MKRLLLDTHILLWAAQNSQRLTSKARELINDPQNEVFFSVASLWEIGIKFALGRDDFAISPADLHEGLASHDYVELPILTPHALLSARLPALHKDPFDRMLVAQAMVENLTLITADATVAAYSPSFLKL